MGGEVSPTWHGDQVGGAPCLQPAPVPRSVPEITEIDRHPARQPSNPAEVATFAARTARWMSKTSVGWQLRRLPAPATRPKV